MTDIAVPRPLTLRALDAVSLALALTVVPLAGASSAQTPASTRVVVAVIDSSTNP